MPRPKLLGLDFDGTVVAHRFPEIGEVFPGAVEVLKELQNEGVGIILNTCREDQPERRFLHEAAEWFAERHIGLRSINANNRQDEFREFEGERRKVFADVYLDDRDFFLDGVINWWEIRKRFVRMGWLPRLAGRPIWAQGL